MKYYVYTHTYNGVLLYVGKGTGDRCHQLSKRNQQYNNFLSSIIFDTGFKVEKLIETDNELEAFYIEAEMIKELKPKYNAFYPNPEYFKLLLDGKSVKCVPISINRKVSESDISIINKMVEQGIDIGTIGLRFGIARQIIEKIIRYTKEGKRIPKSYML